MEATPGARLRAAVVALAPGAPAAAADPAAAVAAPAARRARVRWAALRQRFMFRSWRVTPRWL